jgi:hypothetical protein
MWRNCRTIKNVELVTSSETDDLFTPETGDYEVALYVIVVPGTEFCDFTDLVPVVHLLRLNPPAG